MPKILLVEDDKGWQTILKDEIREALNQISFNVYDCLRSVENFSEAWQALKNEGPWDLLITDILLPPEPQQKGHGHWLVQLACRLKVPTIVVSGQCDAEEVRIFLKEFKIYDFFSKGKYFTRNEEFYQEIKIILQTKNGDTKRKKGLPPYCQNFQDFLVIVNASNRIRVSSEQGNNSDDFRLKMNRIKSTLKRIEIRETDKDLLKSLGVDLFQALFPTAIRDRLRATMAGATAAGCGVRLRLVFESPELAALPWEFLYDEDTNTFLANDIQTALSRYIDVPLPPNDIRTANLPLKILLVVASPTDLVKLDAVGEEQLIRDALSKHIKQGRIELDVLSEATILNINQKLHEKSYDVIHFIGHGVFENEKGFIALVDEDGKPTLLDDERFANLFLGNRNLSLAVLNSCQGAGVSSNQIFAGIAPHLVQRGIPAVVAMQYSILDSTAKLFADEFYRTLALGWPVDAAIQTTRNAISIEVGLDRRDFATPVLYMRAKDGVILEGL